MKKLKKLQHDLHDAVKTLKRNPDRNTIHTFRVAVKKMRAHLRLLAKEKKKKLPRKIKALYQAAGDFRNIELHTDAINSIFAASQQPTAYLVFLETERKKRLKKFQTALDNVKLSKIKNVLPRKATDKNVVDGLPGFTRIKQQEVRTTVHKKIMNDNDLHQVRKDLKDIMYTTDDDKKNSQKTKNRKQLADKLGEFMDRSTSLSFFKQTWLKKISVFERKRMEKVYQEWKFKNENLKNILSAELQTEGNI